MTFPCSVCLGCTAKLMVFALERRETNAVFDLALAEVSGNRQGCVKHVQSSGELLLSEVWNFCHSQSTDTVQPVRPEHIQTFPMLFNHLNLEGELISYVQSFMSNFIIKCNCDTISQVKPTMEMMKTCISNEAALQPRRKAGEILPRQINLSTQLLCAGKIIFSMPVTHLIITFFCNQRLYLTKQRRNGEFSMKGETCVTIFIHSC